MITNNYINKQITSISKALSHSKCHCEAEDYALEFLSKARKNPSVSKVVEEHLLKYSNNNTKNFWKSLKKAWGDAESKVNKVFNEMYPNTQKIRKKLIKTHRVNLEKITPKMTQLEKFVFRYLR